MNLWARHDVQPSSHARQGSPFGVGYLKQTMTLHRTVIAVCLLSLFFERKRHELMIFPVPGPVRQTI